jgi:hypothetical protein
MPIHKRVASIAIVAALLAACSNSGTTTSPSTTGTSPVTVTFASDVAVRGSASRAFTMTTAGTVKVTLTTFGNGTIPAGVGVGVPAAGAPCSVAQSVITAPGDSPQIVTSADAGTYCAEVFDTGSLVQDTPFSLVIEHP